MSRYDGHFLWRAIKKHKRRLLAANGIAMLAVMASVPTPLLLPLLVDELALGQPGWITATVNQVAPAQWQVPALYILLVCVTTICLRAISLVLNVLQGRQFTYIAKELIYQIRVRLLSHLQSVQLAHYETLGSGRVAAKLVTDLDTIDQFVSVSVSRLLISVFSIMGAAAMLLFMHWQLALFILLLNPMVVYLTQALGKRVKELKKRQNSAYEVFQGALTETLDAMAQIRAANRDGHYLQQLMQSAAQVRHHSAAFAWQSDAVSRLSFMVFLVGMDLFRALALVMVLWSDLSVGEMFAVFGYLWFLMGPVQEVLSIQYSWHGAKAALLRINELLEMESEPRYPTVNNPFAEQATVAIRLQDLHFSYDPHKEVLHGVNLNIPAGQKVALVGASGGGKSTLVQLLLGLYQPQQGQVYFDDVPVTNIGYPQVREHVATVLQHPVIFNDSVRANLSLGRDCQEQQLWQALQVACLDDVIQALPDGLDSQLGRQGVRLSGGQRQRLAIARMVLSQPKVVVLDEATSALDTATEEQVHRNLQQFLTGRTTLIVAHRLSAVRQADHVVVFDDGRVVEQGDHQNLLAAGGVYSQLYG